MLGKMGPDFAHATILMPIPVETMRVRLCYLMLYTTVPLRCIRRSSFGTVTLWMDADFSLGKNRSGVQILFFNDTTTWSLPSERVNVSRGSTHV